MKTKQTKIDRSAAKWLPGAMALAATTASSQAAIVQITLTGNKISSTGGNQLNADVTGDGVGDVDIRQARVAGYSVAVRLSYQGNARWLSAFGSSSSSSFGVGGRFAFGGVGVASATGGEVQSISYLNAMTFTDPGINGGAPTGGWLQVNAFNTSATNHTVEFARLIFDDESTTRPGYSAIPGVQTEWQVSAVPEPGSNLALLALGAGGLTLRRRLKRAA